MHLPRIVITAGEPAGIGPDACVMLAQAGHAADLIIAGDAGLLADTARSLSLPLSLEPYHPSQPRVAQRPGYLRVLNLPLRQPVRAGQLDPLNAAYVIATLDRACDGCLNGEFDAMVTAPVQKSTLIEGGYAEFTGHTEYLAQRSRAALPVMMLVNETLRVALVTTHLPLSQVPQAITAARLRATLAVVHMDLQRHFGLSDPRIAVLGLNPHAGESGHLGREEIEVIAPVIEELRGQGMRLLGPVPADTAFTSRFLTGCDAVLAMYHDQGLPVIKHVGFGNAVNVTLGLPILRTSVDHGTALALARTGQADAGSLEAAVGLAIELADGGDANAGP